MPRSVTSPKYVFKRAHNAMVNYFIRKGDPNLVMAMPTWREFIGDAVPERLRKMSEYYVYIVIEFDAPKTGIRITERGLLPKHVYERIQAGHEKDPIEFRDNRLPLGSVSMSYDDLVSSGSVHVMPNPANVALMAWLMNTEAWPISLESGLRTDNLWREATDKDDWYKVKPVETPSLTKSVSLILSVACDHTKIQ